MGFDRELAAIRFGTGLSPVIAPPESVQGMMRRLGEPDLAAERFPIDGYDVFAKRVADMSVLLREKRKMRKEPEQFKKLAKQIKVAKRDAKIANLMWLWQALLRRTHAEDGLRERLAFFWGDHFTARGKVNVMKRVGPSYIESAIRPHVAGPFADMLKAVLRSPAMLIYLDQRFSIGPESAAAKDRRLDGRSRGLNENLAREVLELHTLGVNGAYSQRDVTELAELFTGLTLRPTGQFEFDPAYAEPGSEEVLGKRYGGDPAALSHVDAVLEDLALRSETAQHLASKMARHFVSDRPSEALVDAMASRYLGGGGHLGEMTAAMLEHPDAWLREGGNAKLPIDFIGSAMRAMNVHERLIRPQDHRQVSRLFAAPLVLMGQRYQMPLGPDGWDEEDEAWITPQRLAARFDWAMSAPRALVKPLPDPREFVDVALGGRAPEAVRFAARAAEDRWTGIGLVLASAAFQRM